MSTRAIIYFLSIGLISGCASSQMKARMQQRDKLAQSSGAYCEFVNGEIFHDVDVQMNIEMAKKCDMDKSFSITSYRTPSENQGVIYCCVMADKKPMPAIKSDKSSKGEEKK